MAIAVNLPMPRCHLLHEIIRQTPPILRDFNKPNKFRRCVFNSHQSKECLWVGIGVVNSMSTDPVQKEECTSL